MSKSAVTEREVFDRCLALRPRERSAYLDEVALEDPGLSRRVRNLLDAHDRAEALSLSGLASMKQQAPEKVGPYRLGRILGEGGMGVVYSAEQTFPVRRKVALKLVRRGMDSKRVIARFEAERQALAVMDHPNIARVLDAGSTGDGRPFFVMELVDGESLLSYCDRHQLKVSERLELFLPLCDAIQHAHQKGVIHRDLKPNNVLVSRQEGKTRVKVIDFGIAKAVGGPQPRDATFDTQLGTALGTPAYMSPEQAENSGLDVDTRTDIYSLGVMLYEVLVGAPPLEAEGLGVHALVARLLSSDYEPPPPSVRFAGLGEERERIAAQRKTVPASLKRELVGDLDWIVMKAIHKDRERRYQTANALAVELTRYLKDEPVMARPPTHRYKARKFFRRHRPLVAAAGLAVLALMVGGIGLVAGLVQADQARQEALLQAQKASEAEQAAQGRIRNALLAQARSMRRSHAPGRRVESLELLAQAAEIRPGNDIRDEAIAATTLTDIRLHARWVRNGEQGTIVAFSPSLGTHAWGRRGGAIEVGDGFSGVTNRELPAFGADPWGFRFSPDGRFLAVKYHGDLPTRNAEIRIWDLSTGQVRLRPSGALAGLAMAFSPDGRRFAYATLEDQMRLIDLENGEILWSVTVGAEPAHLAFTADGRRLAVAVRDGGFIEIRDSATARLLNELRHDSLTYRVDWAADGNSLVAGYADKKAIVWDVASETPRAVLSGHQAEVVQVGYHPVYALVFTYSWDETTRIWNARTGEQLLVIPKQALGFSREGRFLAFLEGGTVGIWELLHGLTYRMLVGHQGKNPNCVDISRDGRWLASGGDDGIYLWDPGREDPVARIDAGSVNDLYFDHGGKSIISCGSKGLLVWPFEASLTDNTKTVPWPIREDYCRYATLDARREVVAAVFANRRIVLHSLKGETGDREWEGFPGMAHLSLAAGGGLLAAGNWRGDRTVVFDAVGDVVATLLPGRTSVATAFSTDGRFLVTGTSESYQFWSTEDWSELERIERPARFSHLPGKLSFSDNGMLLALVVDQWSIGLYDPAGRTPSGRFEFLEPQAFTGIRLSRDGNLLVAASSANRLHVWNLSQVLRELKKYRLDGDLASRWPGARRGSVSW